jgi:hypothetical protein
MGLQERFGNLGCQPLDISGVAIFQGTDELNSTTRNTPLVTCCHSGIVRCVHFPATTACLQKMEVLNVTKLLHVDSYYGLFFFDSVYCFRKSLILAVRRNVSDTASAQ